MVVTVLGEAKLGGLTTLLSNSHAPLCPVWLPGNQTKCLTPPSGAFSNISCWGMSPVTETVGWLAIRLGHRPTHPFQNEINLQTKKL